MQNQQHLVFYRPSTQGEVALGLVAIQPLVMMDPIISQENISDTSSIFKAVDSLLSDGWQQSEQYAILAQDAG